MIGYGIPILPPLTALTLFAVWALVLVLSVGGWRAVLVISGKSKITGFPGGTQHGDDAYWRLNRAHANAVENLPIFGSLILAGTLMQVQDTAFQILPSLVLYARVVQSFIHVTSGSALAINLRFAAYAVQVASMLALAYCVLRATGVPLP
jgi:uncharacterized membrane protein YecN with MAPEG domain